MMAATIGSSLLQRALKNLVGIGSRSLDLLGADWISFYISSHVTGWKSEKCEAIGSSSNSGFLRGFRLS